jgi:hypothetical protein
VGLACELRVQDYSWISDLIWIRNSSWWSNLLLIVNISEHCATVLAELKVKPESPCKSFVHYFLHLILELHWVLAWIDKPCIVSKSFTGPDSLSLSKRLNLRVQIVRESTHTWGVTRVRCSSTITAWWSRVMLLVRRYDLQQSVSSSLAPMSRIPRMTDSGITFSKAPWMSKNTSSVEKNSLTSMLVQFSLSYLIRDKSQLLFVRKAC